jgi:hypothetical protein
VHQAQITQISLVIVGYSATSASNPNFIGYQAGYNRKCAYNSNFFGYQAGIAQQMYSSNYLNQYWGWGEECLLFKFHEMLADSDRC